MKVPNSAYKADALPISLSRLQNEGSQPVVGELARTFKSIKATE